MKTTVKKVEPEFEPVVITLETKEEAEAMWHRLNIGIPAFTGGGYRVTVDKGFLTKVHTSMFHSFNKQYRSENA
jgi:hypothetical protein